MRSFTLLLVTLSGCLCGAYSGAGDTVYMRGTDVLIVCSNGGYAANLATGHQEGRFAHETGTIGETGAVAFKLTPQPDGTMTGLGDGAWSAVTLDQTALDHADVECSDLTMRSWWAVAPTVLPTNTAFARRADPTVKACLDSQTKRRDTDPCIIQVELCSSGAVAVTDGGTGTYTTDAGQIAASSDLGAWFTGTYTPDGVFSTSDVDGDGQPDVWHEIPLALLSVDVHCN